MKAPSKILRLPGIGRVAVVADRNGEASFYPGGLPFRSNLSAQVTRNGKILLASEALKSSWMGRHRLRNERVIDLGSGLITNAGVSALANDFAWAQNCQTLKLANQHMTGTGTTAAAATDIYLQTISTHGGQTAVAGTQSLVSAANLQKYQSVATINYTGSESVTEWGLHSSATQSATTGSPATASSPTSLTATATPYTASSSSVRGEQQYIAVDSTAGVWGLIVSNTGGVLTVPAWYKITDGTAGSTPGATDAFAIYPVMWDHKTFASIGDLYAGRINNHGPL
jgi:hypothetical protein